MRECGWSGCDELVFRINPRTSKSFFYCEEHRIQKNAGFKSAYSRIGERRRSQSVDCRRKLRSKFLEMYGGKCICCHIDEEAFLALDHIQDDGGVHRKQRTSYGIYVDATAKHDPERFQILCHNCNFAKYRNGVCPHQLVGQKGINS